MSTKERKTRAGARFLGGEPSYVFATLRSAQAVKASAPPDIAETSSAIGLGTRVGPLLKALRVEKNLTLGDVHERTGLPVSSLSKIENGKMSPTYDKLVRLAQGLDVDLAQIISKDASYAETPQFYGRRSVTRDGAAPVIDTGNYCYHYQATDLLKKSFTPMIVDIKCRSIEAFGDLIQHPGEEYALVLDGLVIVYTDHYAPVRLNRGESVYFDSSMGHAYIAGSAETCRILSVCSYSDNEGRWT